MLLTRILLPSFIERTGSAKKKPRPGQARRTLNRAIGVSFWPRQEPKKHQSKTLLTTTNYALGVPVSERLPGALLYESVTK